MRERGRNEGREGGMLLNGRDGGGVSSRCVYAGGCRRKRARVYRERGARAYTCTSRAELCV